MNTPLLTIKSLEKSFPVYGKLGRLFKPKEQVYALANVSLDLYEGEIYGLVGESGSGKTTTGRSIVGLTSTDSGSIHYQGIDITDRTKHPSKVIQKDIQMIFQDPFSSLNPRKRIGAILEEPLIIHGMYDPPARPTIVMEMLRKVGLGPEHYYRYPHEFSGGQRQRICIARALIVQPKIIVCDEPVSALDVSIQAQIIELLFQLQQDMKLTLLFITHDLSVVRHISDRVGIMNQGKIVEEAVTDDLFESPLHPYTQKLFASIPDFAPLEDAQEIPVPAEDTNNQPIVSIVDEYAFSNREYGTHYVLVDPQENEITS